MPPGVLRLLFGWIALMLLWGLEFGLSFVHMSPSIRSVLLIVAAGMVLVVGLVFMHVGRGPTIVRGFAVVAIFWIIVLLGLGSMDPLTREQYSTRVDYPT